MHIPQDHLPSSVSTMNIPASTVNQTAAAEATAMAAISPSLTAVVLHLFREFHAVEVFLAISIYMIFRAVRQQRREGLSTWPVIGMLPSLLVALRGDMYEWITDVLHVQGGTFTFHGPWFTNLHCVVTADPRNLEHILKERFPSFPKGPYFQGTVSDLLGGGIFAADGEPWRRQRSPASVLFHSAEFRGLTARSLVELVHNRMLPVLETFRSSGASFDFQDVLLRLTFDNVCMIAFGADPGCLRPGLPEIPFARDFEEATTSTIIRFVTPTAIWKALRTLGLASEGTLKRCLNGIDGFAYSVINKRKQELASGDPTAAARSDLLTVYMGLRDEEGMPHSDKFLRDVCVNFILAGRDTSSVALAWFFWLLNRHPEVERKVLEEVVGILKARKDGRTVEVDEELVIRPEEVKKMEYLHAALSESLRLYPSVPVDHKEVIEDEEFPDGTVLKKGTKILYTIYVMGRMESIWGPDCRDFKPERWLNRDGRFLGESAYKFTAFNGGPRLCLGKEMAYYQMKFVAASILLRYRVKVVEGHPIEPKLALTMYMKHGLKVTVEKRDGAEIAGLMKMV